MISETLRQYHPGITDHKRRIYSEGLVRIARSLAHVVTFDIVANGFKRIGLDPVDPQLCFANCRQDILESIGKTKLDDVALKIPDMAEHFKDSHEGELREDVMDEFGVPTVEIDDRRKLPKHNRTQSHQRAVVLNPSGARKRRKEYLAKRKMSKTQIVDQEVEPKAKRPRKPNRSKEEIEASKRAAEKQRAEKAAKKAKKN